MSTRSAILKTAWLNLRYSLTDRIQAFEQGLKRMGYQTRPGITEKPADGDLLVTWNRIGTADMLARRFDHVLVVENAAWGNGFLGRQWLSIAKDRHNTAGMFPVGGPERWDALGAELSDWRSEGETVILPQRGIGSAPTAMPKWWAQSAHAHYGGRVRLHPGKNRAVDLKDDLARCGRVVTWGSGAAVQALMWGIPVVSEMPRWIAEQNNTDAGRLAMFRRLAWAQWTMEEIRTAEPFARML